MWTIHWADSKDRWLRYDEAKPSQDVGDLIEALDADVYGRFFG